LSLHDVSPRFERIYYYEYRGQSEAEQKEVEEKKRGAFESGLVEAKPDGGNFNDKGEVRPAYCVLAFPGESFESCKPTIENNGVVSTNGKSAWAEIDPNGLATAFNYRLGEGTGENQFGFGPEAYETAVRSLGPFLTSQDVSVNGRNPYCHGEEYEVIAKNAAGTTHGAPHSCSNN